MTTTKASSSSTSTIVTLSIEDINKASFSVVFTRPRHVLAARNVLGRHNIASHHETTHILT